MNTCPMMASEHVRVITDALMAIKPPVIVHEWGCGGSTVHWARALYGACVDYRWTSVEHSPRWANDVRGLVDGLPVDVRVFDYGTPDVRLLPCEAYVDSLDGPADIVIIDGRKRARCARRALGRVFDGGRVFVHDFERGYYDDILKLGYSEAIRHRAANGSELLELRQDDGPQKHHKWQSDI